MPKKVSIAIVLALLFGIAGIVTGLVALTSNATDSSPATGNLPHGFFVDGKVGSPHYVVSVVPTSPDHLKGAVDYIYQDGQSDVSFTFSGLAQGGLANLHVHYAGSSSAHNNGPTSIVMLYNGRSVQLGECPSFLRLAMTLPACNFRAASTPSA